MADATRARRLLGFGVQVFAPGLHLAFAALWLLALEGALVLATGAGSWRFGLDLLLAILSNFFVLFFLRLADEIKDLEYDREHNPDRPLVTGLVSQREVAGFLAATAAVVAGLNAVLPRAALVVALCDMAYALLLILLERVSARVRDGIFLNLLVTYPLNIALSVYIYLLFLQRYGRGPDATGLLVLGAFVLAFLHYELGRKTAWPGPETAGERLYSAVVGAPLSALMALGCAIGASGLVLYAVAPWRLGGLTAAAGWLQLLPLLFAGYGVWRFFGARGRSGKKVITPFAMLYLLSFYLVLLGLGLLGNTLALAG